MVIGETMGVGLGIFIFGMVLTFIGLIIFLTILWILMIVDAAQRDFKNKDERVIWILLLVFLGVLGAIIYYFAVKMPDKR